MTGKMVAYQPDGPRFHVGNNNPCILDTKRFMKMYYRKIGLLGAWEPSFLLDYVMWQGSEDHLQNFKSIHAKLKKDTTVHVQLRTLQLRSKT